MIASLSGLGSGGPDDNDGQGGRLVVPISGDALREGTAKTPSPDAEGRVRLRDPGLGISAPGDPAFTLAAAGPGAVAAPLSHGSNPNSAVRRLTPTECCRLQGFPDDWLGLPNEPPDSPRYAALGDAVTVPVAEWVGRRIMEAEAVA